MTVCRRRQEEEPGGCGIRSPSGSRDGMGREKLIVDVHFHKITGRKPGIRFGTFPIDLDALVAEGFIHHAARQLMRNTFHKTAQADTVFVGAGGKIFHTILAC